MPIVRTKITPPALAREYGVEPNKVLTWIRNGELRAIDASTIRGARPRYLINCADIAAFEAARSAGPVPKVSRVRRRSDPGVTKFF